MPENRQNGSKANGRKQEKEPYLKHNKSPLKYFMPRSEHLKDIRFGEIDLPFMLLIVVLLVFGVVMMYSASYAWAIHEGKTSDYYFQKQISHMLIGLVGMLLLSSKIFDYHILNAKWVNIIFFIVCVFLMLLVYVPGIGVSEAEAKRWVNLGFISFQPSEIMKIGLIVMLANIMSSRRLKMNTFLHGVGFPGCVLLVVCLLTLAQRHISATIIVISITAAMILVSGVRKRDFAKLIGIGLILAGIAIVVLSQTGHFNYVSDRFLAMNHLMDDTYRDEVWQTRNSVIAIGSGGLFGLGFGNSRQKFLYLPESHNDFVFAIVCEELGFIGAAAVIILFLALIFRGFNISEKAPDKFGMMLSMGLVFQIGLQALLNIGVVANALPNTGISLPFFSYGGTALILQLCEMGIVLNISRQSIPKEEKKSSSTAKELRRIQDAKNKLST